MPTEKDKKQQQAKAVLAKVNNYNVPRKTTDTFGRTTIMPRDTVKIDRILDGDTAEGVVIRNGKPTNEKVSFRLAGLNTAETSKSDNSYFINKFTKENGRPPTVAEMQKEFSLGAKQKYSLDSTTKANPGVWYEGVFQRDETGTPTSTYGRKVFNSNLSASQAVLHPGTAYPKGKFSSAPVLRAVQTGNNPMSKPTNSQTKYKYPLGVQSIDIPPTANSGEVLDNGLRQAYVGGYKGEETGWGRGLGSAFGMVSGMWGQGGRNANQNALNRSAIQTQKQINNQDRRFGGVQAQQSEGYVMNQDLDSITTKPMSNKRYMRKGTMSYGDGTQYAKARQELIRGGVDSNKLTELEKRHMNILKGYSDEGDRIKFIKGELSKAAKAPVLRSNVTPSVVRPQLMESKPIVKGSKLSTSGSNERLGPIAKPTTPMRAKADTTKPTNKSKDRPTFNPRTDPTIASMFRGFTPEQIEQVHRSIAKASKETGIDPRIIYNKAGETGYFEPSAARAYGGDTYGAAGFAQLTRIAAKDAGIDYDTYRHKLDLAGQIGEWPKYAKRVKDIWAAGNKDKPFESLPKEVQSSLLGWGAGTGNNPEYHKTYQKATIGQTPYKNKEVNANYGRYYPAYETIDTHDIDPSYYAESTPTVGRRMATSKKSHGDRSVQLPDNSGGGYTEIVDKLSTLVGLERQEQKQENKERPKLRNGKSFTGGSTQPGVTTQYAKGNSGIHIKPENKGKFTAYANSHGQSVQQAASSVLANPNASPTLKKRANFARNAAKWHRHGTDDAKYGGVEVERDELIFRPDEHGYQLVADFKGGKTHEQGGEPFIAKEGDVIFPGKERNSIIGMVDGTGRVHSEMMKAFERARHRLPKAEKGMRNVVPGANVPDSAYQYGGSSQQPFDQPDYEAGRPMSDGTVQDSIRPTYKSYSTAPKPSVAPSVEALDASIKERNRIQRADPMYMEGRLNSTPYASGTQGVDDSGFNTDSTKVNRRQLPIRPDVTPIKMPESSTNDTLILPKSPELVKAIKSKYKPSFDDSPVFPAGWDQKARDTWNKIPKRKSSTSLYSTGTQGVESDESKEAHKSLKEMTKVVDQYRRQTEKYANGIGNLWNRAKTKFNTLSNAGNPSNPVAAPVTAKNPYESNDPLLYKGDTGRYDAPNQSPYAPAPTQFQMPAQQTEAGPRIRTKMNPESRVYEDSAGFSSSPLQSTLPPSNKPKRRLINKGTDEGMSGYQAKNSLIDAVSEGMASQNEWMASGQGVYNNEYRKGSRGVGTGWKKYTAGTQEVDPNAPDGSTGNNPTQKRGKVIHHIGGNFEGINLDEVDFTKMSPQDRLKYGQALEKKLRSDPGFALDRIGFGTDASVDFLGGRNWEQAKELLINSWKAKGVDEETINNLKETKTPYSFYRNYGTNYGGKDKTKDSSPYQSLAYGQGENAPWKASGSITNVQGGPINAPQFAPTLASPQAPTLGVTGVPGATVTKVVPANMTNQQGPTFNSSGPAGGQGQNKGSAQGGSTQSGIQAGGQGNKEGAKIAMGGKGALTSTIVNGRKVWSRGAGTAGTVNATTTQSGPDTTGGNGAVVNNSPTGGNPVISSTNGGGGGAPSNGMAGMLGAVNAANKAQEDDAEKKRQEGIKRTKESVAKARQQLNAYKNAGNDPAAKQAVIDAMKAEYDKTKAANDAEIAKITDPAERAAAQKAQDESTASYKSAVDKVTAANTSGADTSEIEAELAHHEAEADKAAGNPQYTPQPYTPKGSSPATAPAPQGGGSPAAATPTVSAGGSPTPGTQTAVPGQSLTTPGTGTPAGGSPTGAPVNINMGTGAGSTGNVGTGAGNTGTVTNGQELDEEGNPVPAKKPGFFSRVFGKNPQAAAPGGNTVGDINSTKTDLSGNNTSGNGDITNNQTNESDTLVSKDKNIVKGGNNTIGGDRIKVNEAPEENMARLERISGRNDRKWQRQARKNAAVGLNPDGSPYTAEQVAAGAGGGGTPGKVKTRTVDKSKTVINNYGTPPAGTGGTPATGDTPGTGTGGGGTGTQPPPAGTPGKPPPTEPDVAKQESKFQEESRSTPGGKVDLAPTKVEEGKTRKLPLAYRANVAPEVEKAKMINLEGKNVYDTGNAEREQSNINQATMNQLGGRGATGMAAAAAMRNRAGIEQNQANRLQATSDENVNTRNQSLLLNQQEQARVGEANAANRAAARTTNEERFAAFQEQANLREATDRQDRKDSKYMALQERALEDQRKYNEQYLGALNRSSYSSASGSSYGTSGGGTPAAAGATTPTGKPTGIVPSHLQLNTPAGTPLGKKGKINPMTGKPYATGTSSLKLPKKFSYGK